jgi:4-diphosphocytidyl-2-C-methyl-D-erythritol kinase
MIKLKTYAKINLNIHLLPNKLENGLYPLKYVICQIDLYDEIFIENIKNKIILTTSDKKLPVDEKNLVYQAAKLLKDEVNNNKLGAKIKIIKKIPVKAGFGGGSSNAASVLLALIKLWGVKITKEQIFKIADQLGKEVYYFLKGGVSEVLYDGSKVNRIVSNMPKIWLVMISPNQKKPSTGYMFESVNPKLIGKNQIKFKKLKKAILKNDVLGIVKNLHNDFELFALKKYPEIIKIKNDLIKNKALSSIMTGAGLYVVGFFDNKVEAKNAYNRLMGSYKSVIFSNAK